MVAGRFTVLLITWPRTRAAYTMGINTRDSVVSAMATFITADMIVILLRVYVRISRKTLGIDDACLILAYTQYCIVCSFFFVALDAGYAATAAEVEHYNATLAAKVCPSVRTRRKPVWFSWETY